MPAGLFDPTFDPEAGPLDLPTPAKKANQWKDLAPLLAILPLALSKGGRVGGAALLEGFQQARQQQAQEARQSSIDAENRSYRDATLQNQRDRLAMEKQGKADADANTAAARRQTFLNNFSSGLDRIETPEALEAYLRLQASQGTSVGVNEADLRGLAPAPTALQQKNARKRLEALEKQFGDKLYEQGPQFRYELAGESVPVSFDELLRRAGQPRDPNAPAPTPSGTELSKSSLDVQLMDAKRRAAAGDPKAADEVKLIEDTIARADSLRRDPADPTLQAIRQLTLAQARQLQQSGGLSPAQFGQAQALANDYQQETKEFWTQRSAYQRVVASSPDTPAGHMALIFAYMKLLDPNSVVRETEYANAQNAAGVPDRVRNLYNATIEGKILTPRQIQDFKAQARAIYKGAKSEALQKKAVYDQRATAQGLPPQSVTYMLDDPAEGASGAPPSPQAPTPPAPRRANPFRR